MHSETVICGVIRPEQSSKFRYAWYTLVCKAMFKKRKERIFLRISKFPNLYFQFIYQFSFMKHMIQYIHFGNILIC